MKTKNLLLALGLGLTLMSCSSNDEPYFNTYYGSGNAEDQMIAVYNDSCYLVGCQEAGDSTVFNNQEFNNIYTSKLANNPSLAILAYKNVIGQDVVEYFDNEQQLKEKYNIQALLSEETSTSDGPNRVIGHVEITGGEIIGRAILYDDVNYRDRSLTIDISTWHRVEIPALKDSNFKFNDKTSAIRVYNYMNPSKNYTLLCGTPSMVHEKTFPGSILRVCSVGYEHTNYKGKVLYCIGSYSGDYENYAQAPITPHQDWNLKKIGWNDKISAVVVDVFQTMSFSYELRVIGLGGIEPHEHIN